MTIWDNQNYGNRLQNFALQSFLEGLGVTATTVRNFRAGERHGRAAGDQPWTQGAKDAVRHAGRGIRASKFTAFNRRRLHATLGRVDADAPPPGLAKSFDVFVTGSDQVWNPLWRGTDLDFLAFAPPAKRTAYAASFGVARLDRSSIERYARLLAQMRAISVREREAAEIVYDLTGRSVPVHIDPVMLLDVNQWNKINSSQRLERGRPRIVTYLLGQPSLSRNQVIDAAAGLLAARVASYKDPRDVRRYLAGPGDFVGELATADLVLTDSFHAAAFAVLFERPLAVLPREGISDQSSRIKTLMATFSLSEDILVQSPDGLRGALAAKRGDVSARLMVERQRAREYLLSALISA